MTVLDYVDDEIDFPAIFLVGSETRSHQVLRPVAVIPITEVVMVIGNEWMKGFPMDSMIVVWIGFKQLISGFVH